MSASSNRWSGRRREVEEALSLQTSSVADSNSSVASSSRSRHVRSMSESAQLPPAVASVLPEVLRTYVHNKKINNYLVGDTLGEGSFAKVKEALHVLVGEKVAMKIIDKKKAQQDPYVAKNFRREAKLLQMVRHPNILQLFEVIETDTSFYLITELCSGGELMNYIYKKHRLDEEETHKFMRQIVSAVDHLHRAGIIHRDLKVENMLLDSSMDIKIIDLGLSNEEYIESENGQLHCNTQCGSPAYAAPELLGHKEYSKEVDIWSIGVNMYAMLTGHLPYTVEPFNITALHAKMLQNKMNPIPDHLSSDCKDLLCSLLRPNPAERITMADLIKHPWMNKRHSLPFGPAPFPNKLESKNVIDEIIEHMVHVLKMHDSSYQLKQELLQNRANSTTAVYNLLVTRLAKYQYHMKSSTRRKRTKSCLVRDKEPVTVDSMTASTSRPQRSRRGSRKISPGVNPSLTSEKMEKSLSTPSVVEEVITATIAPTSFSRARTRRQSVPAAMLEKELADFNAKKKEEANVKQWQTHHQRPNTSALPEVRQRKTSAPTPPLGLSVQTADKEVHLRMHVHQQDNFDVKARRRQSVPSSVLEKELVNFQIGSAREKSTERRPGTSSTLPRLNKVSPLPRDAKHNTINGFIHRTFSMPDDCDELDQQTSASLTRNVHSYPVSLSRHGEQTGPNYVPSTNAWGQSKQTTTSKTSKFHTVSSGLTLHPPPQPSDTFSYDTDDYQRERVKRKISPGDRHLPALMPTEHAHNMPSSRLYTLSDR